MSHDNRLPAWIALALVFLAILLAFRVSTPRVRLTSGENLQHPSIRQVRKVTPDAPGVRAAGGEEESYGSVISLSDPLPLR